jgi:hypothetical protein
MLTAEIEAESVRRNIVTAIPAALAPGSVVGLPVLGATLLPVVMRRPSSILCPTALLLPGCRLLLGALLGRIVALASLIASLRTLHWRRLRRQRTLRYIGTWPIRLLLGALSLLRLRLRPLGPLFLLRPLALLSGRLCALLLLRSALLPLGTGLSLRLAPIFASILLLFLLVSLRKAGNYRAGHQD